jgi:hypothetical protein
MIENSWISYLALFFFGAMMGFSYLGLLWFSVKKFTCKKLSTFQTLLGFFLRLAVMGLTLFYIAQWFQFEGILFYLLGFFIVKKILQKKIYGYYH